MWGNWIVLPPNITHYIKMDYIKMVESHFSDHCNCHISERKQSAFHEHFISLESLRFPRRISHIIKQKCLVWSILQHCITFPGKSFMKELTVFILFRVVLHTLIKHMMTAGIGHGSLNIILLWLFSIFSLMKWTFWVNPATWEWR